MGLRTEKIWADQVVELLVGEKNVCVHVLCCEAMVIQLYRFFSGRL